jgi:hypothetical protein
LTIHNDVKPRPFDGDAGIGVDKAEKPCE